MYYTPILLGPPSSAIGVRREERPAIKLSLSASLARISENRASPTQTPRDRQPISKRKFVEQLRPRTLAHSRFQKVNRIGQSNHVTMLALSTPWVGWPCNLRLP